MCLSIWYPQPTEHATCDSVLPEKLYIARGQAEEERMERGSVGKGLTGNSKQTRK